MVLLADALEHPRRVALLEIVRDSPGLSFRGLVARSGIPAGTCRHHLNILKRHGHLVEERVKKSQLAFYPPGLTTDERREAHVRLEERMVVVRDAVAGLANPCQSDVQDALAMPRSTVQHVLSRLVELGAVQARPEGRYLRYSVPEAPRRALIGLLAHDLAEVEA